MDSLRMEAVQVGVVIGMAALRELMRYLQGRLGEAVPAVAEGEVKAE